MRLNSTARAVPVFTHEGAPAFPHLTDYQQLRRTVLACLLWEDQFYEDGIDIATRIAVLSQNVTVEQLSDLAIEARSVHNLRHVPLLLLCALVRRGGGNAIVSNTIEKVLQRADEPGELLSIYWSISGNKHMLPAQLRKGIAKAFPKFQEYNLAKYDRDSKVKLRDVLRLARPTPKDEEQSLLWKRVVKRELKTPDTWEVALSSGADKKETFERLLKEGQLGYLALLRNLRNMVQAGCDLSLVRDAILAGKGAKRVLPFRYIAAARAAPQLEPELDKALIKSLEDVKPLDGKTVVLVDVSGSMDWSTVSKKSDITRMDAACALATILQGNIQTFSFSDDMKEIPPRKGMSMVDAIQKSQSHSGTQLGRAVNTVNTYLPCDRLIVITDEQSHDRVPDPVCKKAYMINVASNKNGVGYGKWTHIDGFSEGVIKYISEIETID